MLADFFVEVGCHSNLRVAMFAVDSLRQLAMKFLERDELANYTFQNDFLKPFVSIMRQSKSVEIRELIIRQVQLIDEDHSYMPMQMTVISCHVAFFCSILMRSVL